MYKHNIAVVTVVIVICTLLGGIGIPYLVDNVESAEEDLIKSALADIHNGVLTKISSNITALNTYLSIVLDGMSELHELSAELQRYQILADDPLLYSGFNIIRITYFQVVFNEEEMYAHIEDGKRLYNVSSFQPYNLVSGSAIPINVTTATYPLMLLLVATPFGSSPGLPRFGSFNAISVSPIEGPAIARFNDTEYSMSEIFRSVRVDGTVNTIIALSTRFRSWMAAAQFELDNFLRKTLVTEIASGHAVIEVADAEGVFFRSAEEKTSGHVIQDTIQFRFRNWMVTTHMTQDYADSFRSESSQIIRITTVCIIVVIFVTAIAILYGASMSVRAQRFKLEAESNSRIQAIHNSYNVAIHEIRNIINCVHVVSTMVTPQSIQEDDITMIKTGMNNVINLLSNILDYEKLLHGRYIAKPERVNVVNLLSGFLQRYPFVTVDYSYDNSIFEQPHMDLDKDKLQALIQNGMNNGCKFSEDKRISVRLHRLPAVGKEWMLVEIINSYSPDDVFDTSDIFIPFFIRDAPDQHIWRETLNKLEQDNGLFAMASSRFSVENLENSTQFEQRADYEQSFTIRSTGLGLSISRLISKALSGECGLVLDNDAHVARYWFILPLDARTTEDLQHPVVHRNEV